MDRKMKHSVQSWAGHIREQCASWRTPLETKNQYCALYFLHLFVHLSHHLSTAVVCLFSLLRGRVHRRGSFLFLFMFIFSTCHETTFLLTQLHKVLGSPVSRSRNLQAPHDSIWFDSVGYNPNYKMIIHASWCIKMFSVHYLFLFFLCVTTCFF